MQKYAVLCNLVVFAVVTATLNCDRSTREDLHFNDPELIQYINNELETTWKAGYNGRFQNVDHDVIRGMLGVKPIGIIKRPIRVSKTKDLNLEIPDSFDSREKWRECPSLKEVRDQSACGSCWAFGAVEAMSDRICIASHGKHIVELSSDDLLSCCRSCGYGCDGGEPLAAWQYWVENGIVTGTNYTAGGGCKPYPFPPCEHHINSTHYRPCKHDLYPTPTCTHQCRSGYKNTYDDDKWYGSHAFSVEQEVSSIQKEVMTNGPVEAAFMVYEDFLHYKSGVYQHHAGKIDGGHAVKIIGWGSENSTPYWLVANSWNSDWGLGGFFKILRGQDECGIESQIVAGLPRSSSWQLQPKKPRNSHRNQY